jgi:ABC-type uncharacterized transport system auxiliary subunit
MLGLVLVACVAGPAPEDHFYRLELGAPPDALDPPPLPGALSVLRLRTDAVTGERQILFHRRSDPIEVHRHTYHYWLDPPATMLQTQLVAYLRSARAAHVVSDELRVRADFVLSGRIVALERLLGDGESGVAVELEFTLMREADRQVVLQHTYREEREVEGRGMSRSVGAFSEAVRQIFDRLLVDLAAIRSG